MDKKMIEERAEPSKAFPWGVVRVEASLTTIMWYRSRKLADAHAKDNVTPRAGLAVARWCGLP